MLTNSRLILTLFILPEVKDTSNPRSCDIINSDRLSDPEISNSVSQYLMLLDWLLISTLKLFGQISVTADEWLALPIFFKFFKFPFQPIGPIFMINWVTCVQCLKGAITGNLSNSFL